MSIENRVAALQKKHSDLDKAVVSAQMSASADNIEITSLKKQKLALKDEMERLVAN